MMYFRLHLPKKPIIFFFTSVFFASCDFISPISQAKEISKDIDSATNLLEIAMANSRFTNAIWQISHNSKTGDLIPVKKREVLSDTLTFEKLRFILLLSYPEVGVVSLIDQRNDTLFVELGNGDYLTQQMGTTGAQEFLMAATYTLTELKGVKYVYFDFEEGDNAVPGVYSRDSW